MIKCLCLISLVFASSCLSHLEVCVSADIEIDASHTLLFSYLDVGGEAAFDDLTQNQTLNECRTIVQSEVDDFDLRVSLIKEGETLASFEDRVSYSDGRIEWTLLAVE